jgi:hypothetical protein
MAVSNYSLEVPAALVAISKKTKGELRVDNRTWMIVTPTARTLKTLLGNKGTVARVAIFAPANLFYANTLAPTSLNWIQPALACLRLVIQECNTTVIRRQR